MGDLADLDSYDPFDAEKFANPAIAPVMGGLAQMVQTPGELMKPNPYPEGSEEADFYNASKKQAATDWAPGMALNTMGTGAIVGVPVRGAEAVLGAGPIRAYHGSPHDFDRFDLSKIGTGEG